MIGRKNFKELQDVLKDNLKSLDNKQIQDLREIINELVVELGKKAGTTNGNLSFLIDNFKEKEINLIIETEYSNINENIFSPSTIDFQNKIKILIKGKSDFDEIQQIVFNEVNLINDKIKLQENLYNQYLIEINNYCIEIGYILDIDYVRNEIKKIILNSQNIDILKENLKNKLLLQKEQLEKINIQRLQKERLQKEQLEKEKQNAVKQITSANNINKIEEVKIETPKIDAIYNLTLNFNNINKKQMEILKIFLINNEIKFETIEVIKNDNLSKVR